MDADRFLTSSLQDKRLTHILAASLDAVEPGKIVRQKLERIKLPEHNRLFLLGIGKAAEAMTLAGAAVYADFSRALIITKHSFGSSENSNVLRYLDRVKIIESSHPIPDERSRMAGLAVLEFITPIKENDLLVCFISGGGSSLVSTPRKGISLEDIQELTKSMLGKGATIEELNIIRSQLEILKNGGLVGATKGKIYSLILSDVIGDRLSIIASGLTVPIPTQIKKVTAILDKYSLSRIVSRQKLNVITTEKKSDPSVLDRVKNVVIANNKSALHAAKQKAIEDGFTTRIINTNLQGEAYLTGNKLAETLKLATEKIPRPFCLLAGGETTVTIRGNGKGGRNQELALGTVDILADAKNVKLISLATDGNDGPTEAAGAVVDGTTKQRAYKLGMSPSVFLFRNDSFHFFEALDDLLMPGYTGTNVNDILFMFGL